MKGHVSLLSLAIALVAILPARAQTPFSFEVGESHPGFIFQHWSELCPRESTKGPGYFNGVVTGSCVGYGAGNAQPSFFSSASPFTLVSGYFTSAFNGDATLSVWGFRPGDVIPTNGSYAGSQGSASFFVQALITTARPKFVTFDDWSGLSSVAITSSGGKLKNSRDMGLSGWFAADAITVVTATPEPASAALIATGLLGVLGAAYRGRKRT